MRAASARGLFHGTPKPHTLAARWRGVWNAKSEICSLPTASHSSMASLNRMGRGRRGNSRARSNAAASNSVPIGATRRHHVCCAYPIEIESVSNGTCFRAVWLQGRPRRARVAVCGRIVHGINTALDLLSQMHDDDDATQRSARHDAQQNGCTSATRSSSICAPSTTPPTKTANDDGAMIAGGRFCDTFVCGGGCEWKFVSGHRLWGAFLSLPFVQRCDGSVVSTFVFAVPFLFFVFLVAALLKRAFHRWLCAASIRNRLLRRNGWATRRQACADQPANGSVASLSSSC